MKKKVNEETEIVTWINKHAKEKLNWIEKPNSKNYTEKKTKNLISSLISSSSSRTDAKTLLLKK